MKHLVVKDAILEELQRRIQFYENLPEDSKRETMYIASLNENRDLYDFVNKLEVTEVPNN